MKGIILAGGTGSRLDPLTRVTNKHLLPVYDRPMIYFPIQTLVQSGIRDIMIVSGKGHAGHFLELLRSGREFGARFSYGVQERAGGIAEALSICEDFADSQRVAVVLGDNIFEDSLAAAVHEFKQQSHGAMIFLKEVANPQAYGVPVLADGRIVAIEEKPKQPKSNYAVVGAYLYDEQVWEFLRDVTTSARGELEITDVNNHYVHQGTVTYQILPGWWGDGGESFDSLLQAANMVAKHSQEKPDGCLPTKVLGS